MLVITCDRYVDFYCYIMQLFLLLYYAIQTNRIKREIKCFFPFAFCLHLNKILNFIVHQF